MNSKKEKLTLKNYLLGSIIGIIVFESMVVLSHGWSINVLTNWKMLLIVGLAGLGFSLIFVPLVLGSWGSEQQKTKKQKNKQLLIFAIFFVFYFVFNIVQTVLNHDPITWSTFAFTLGYAAFSAWYPY